MGLRPSLYLAGPMLGLLVVEAVEWRRYVQSRFHDLGIDAFSPMRGYNISADTHLENGDPTDPMHTPHGLVARDRFDVTNRDLLFVNFLGSKEISVGTVMEIAWADLARKPIVIAAEPDNIHTRHAMLSEVSSYIVPDMEEAITIAYKLLLP